MCNISVIDGQSLLGCDSIEIFLQCVEVSKLPSVYLIEVNRKTVDLPVGCDHMPRISG